jgi:hypothetical protein
MDYRFPSLFFAKKINWMRIIRSITHETFRRSKSLCF